jgi:hypothetical protein
MKKIALILRGAVAKRIGQFPIRNALYATSPYVNFQAVARSVFRHIIEANPLYRFDIYIQSWNVDLEECLSSIYKPIRARFEDNNCFAEEILEKIVEPWEFAGVSQFLAIRHGIDLVEEEGGDYEQAILYRPDVLIWKDMDLSHYDPEKIYVNAHPDGNGDFHFVMNLPNLYRFRELYAFINRANPFRTHHSIQHFVNMSLKMQLTPDDIRPLLDQEVMRKINDVVPRHIELERLATYGVGPQDL